jgi:hypothetical protein
MGVGTDFVCSCAMPLWTLTVGGTPGKNKGSSGSWGVAGLARLELYFDQQLQRPRYFTTHSGRTSEPWCATITVLCSGAYPTYPINREMIDIGEGKV